MTTTTTPAPSSATATTTSAELHIESAPQFMDEYSPDVAMRMMKAHVALCEEVRKAGRGTWTTPIAHIKPPEYRFCRLGTMADVKRRDAILRQRFILEQQGWRLAPAGTFNPLWAVDGAEGVYMVIAEPAAQVLDEFERQTRRDLASRRLGLQNSTPTDLQGLPRGVHIESVNVSSATMTISEFQATEGRRSPRAR